MAGLLDFFQTPQGVGLLSGIATYAANARRGQPWNSLGRGLAGGLIGYGQAKDAITQEQENAFKRQFQQFQMDDMVAKREREKALRAKLAAGLKPGTPEMPPTTAVDDNGYAMPPVSATQPTFFGKPVSEAEAALIPELDPSEAFKFVTPQAQDGQPANVREWMYFSQLPEEQQRAYLEMKRTQQWGDFGGYRAPLLPGGKVGPAIKKTIDPGKAADIQDRRTEMDYNLPPSKKPSGGVSVTAPDGKTYTFPNQQAADNFRKAIGGQ